MVLEIKFLFFAVFDLPSAKEPDTSRHNSGVVGSLWILISLLRTSGMDRKEQHWGQAHLGYGPWGMLLILANFSESVCLSVRWRLRRLPLRAAVKSVQGW